MANKVVLKNLILVTFFHTGSNNIYIYIYVNSLLNLQQE